MTLELLTGPSLVFIGGGRRTSWREIVPELIKVFEK